MQRVALLGQVGQVLGRRGCGGGGDVGGRQVSQVLPVADLNYIKHMILNKWNHLLQLTDLSSYRGLPDRNPGRRRPDVCELLLRPQDAAAARPAAAPAPVSHRRHLIPPE